MLLKEALGHNISKDPVNNVFNALPPDGLANIDRWVILQFRHDLGVENCEK